jgi:hypothetical protein
MMCSGVKMKERWGEDRHHYSNLVQVAEIRWIRIWELYFSDIFLIPDRSDERLYVPRFTGHMEYPELIAPTPGTNKQSKHPRPQGRMQHLKVQIGLIGNTEHHRQSRTRAFEPW